MTTPLETDVLHGIREKIAFFIMNQVISEKGEFHWSNPGPNGPVWHRFWSSFTTILSREIAKRSASSPACPSSACGQPQKIRFLRQPERTSLSS
jgi:hypothetical protein